MLKGGLIPEGRFNKRSEPGKPLVSIITIVYNGEQLLEPTLLSVLGQTYSNIEYIVVDGSSTDGTLDIIKRYNDQLALWISEPDKGIYDAMNKGLQMAQGDYVWFMNTGDSIAEADTLEKILACGAADIYYGETYLVEEDGKVLGTRSELTTRKLPRRLKFRDMGKGMMVCHQAILVKRSIAPVYDTRYPCSADIDWVAGSLKRANKVVNVQQVIARYLIGGYSIQAQRSCWKERFIITRRHYGFLAACYFSIYIVFRALWHQLNYKN